ncbi:uncharacterized protein J3D65DRAFT_658455 [Phyllosticta citribraziliensis]|uniref:Uncharacterized protein n=1 Tax=Phyllosticta citribraziliensis TaxID=989973 RepID=A0ABR1LP61_9PEZI
MSMAHSQQDCSLAQSMRRLCLSRDVKEKDAPTTTNSTPLLYRPDTSQFTYDTVSVWRVCFYKPLPPGAAEGTERCRLHSKWRQRQLMPLVFDALGIEPDCHWTNGCDRIFSVPEWSLDKKDAASEDRADFELHAPTGAGGRFGVVVELVDKDMAVPRALPVGSSAASLTADQFRFLECAMQAFARAQVWKAKKNGVEGWCLVRRGVAVSFTRAGCLLKLTPLSRTFLAEGSFSKFVESLASRDDKDTIPNDVMELIEKVCSHIKVRYNYLGAGQRKEDGESCQPKILDGFDIHVEGKLRRICAFGSNAEDTKFRCAPRTSGGQSELLSVKGHFENHVFPGTRLRYPKWPLANTGTIEKPTWIPLELLWIETDQPIDELPEQLPVAVSRLFSEKHAENVGSCDENSFGDLLKLDQDRFGIKIKKVQMEQAVVPDPPKTPQSSVQRICGSQDMLLLHVGKECDWDCRAMFRKFFGALQKYGALKSDSVDLPPCIHTTPSRLGQAELSRLLKPPNKQANKTLLIACLSGEKQERDRAYREIKAWGDTENVPTLVVQAQKFRDSMNLWSPDLSKDSDKKKRAAVGYVKSVSKKVLARCGRDSVATQKTSKRLVNGGVSLGGKLNGVEKEVDVPDLKLL